MQFTNPGECFSCLLWDRETQTHKSFIHLSTSERLNTVRNKCICFKSRAQRTIPSASVGCSFISVCRMEFSSVGNIIFLIQKVSFFITLNSFLHKINYFNLIFFLKCITLEVFIILLYYFFSHFFLGHLSSEVEIQPGPCLKHISVDIRSKFT